MNDGARFPRLLTPSEASSLLRVTPGTMRRWRLDGHGPPVTTVGKMPRYDLSDLLRWLDDNRERYDD